MNSHLSGEPERRDLVPEGGIAVELQRWYDALTARPGLDWPDSDDGAATPPRAPR